MKEWFFKYFSRILAVLGCSTMVTACYGSPYKTYNVKVSGTVVDASTGSPVKGIQVRLTVGKDSYDDAGVVQGMEPLSSPVVVYSGTDGEFSEVLYSYYLEPDGIMVECVDIDGSVNGTYQTETQIFAPDDVSDSVIRLELDAE
jgi:putative lipoprotein (rSAM/lipoprotein system)